jgi:hypothetical protein
VCIQGDATSGEACLGVKSGTQPGQHTAWSSATAGDHTMLHVSLIASTNGSLQGTAVKFYQCCIIIIISNNTVIGIVIIRNVKGIIVSVFTNTNTSNTPRSVS